MDNFVIVEIRNVFVLFSRLDDQVDRFYCRCKTFVGFSYQ